jgi:hypothetical protein
MGKAINMGNVDGNLYECDDLTVRVYCETESISMSASADSGKSSVSSFCGFAFLVDCVDVDGCTSVCCVSVLISSLDF